MWHGKRLAGLTIIMGTLFILSAFAQPVLAAERIVRFENPGCA